MNVEAKIEKCEFYLKQIKYFDPEPFYVNYFFSLFIKSVNQVYDGIFEEANNDFGLFILSECNKEKFRKKALIKKDEKALEFVDWFEKKNKKKHESMYPKFIKDVIEFQKKFNKLPKIKIMLRAKERYSKDVNQEILVKLTNGKLRSKKELEIEIKRTLLVFLEIINNKRTSNNEPKVKEKQITASTFMQIKENEECEIVYASEIYIPILTRFVSESREKINHITEWKKNFLVRD